MTVLQTGQMLLVYSRKTSSRSTFCRSGVIVMAEPFSSRTSTGSWVNVLRRYVAEKVPDEPANALSDAIRHSFPTRNGCGPAVGRDRSRGVLVAPSAQPQEPSDAQDAHDGADPGVDAQPGDLV